ncbi:protein kinase [Streptomyces sp. NPDC048282]|uniref:protein kinase domain-containing protein n=1 Tax=Streptomyces sp. NPDC048282 TaxID=3365528 RepID=UPI0037196EE4
MSAPHLDRSHARAYAALGLEAPPPVPLRTGDPVRVGPYALVSVLGSGGMGRVYLGRDTQGGPGPAAVKVIRPEYAEDPKFRRRFEREVGALDRVRGAHTVRLMGSGHEGDLLWVATEYIPGPTLEEAVDRRGPLDAAAGWRLMADLGRAVEAIWRAGIVHRDLKPSNVILAADGARVIDFGIAHAADATSITTTGQHVGTVAFMSPEQVRGHEVTAASDVFTLASTLTYALTGAAPFGEGTGVDVLHRVAFDPPREELLAKVADLDPDLAAYLRQCLYKDPESRPEPDAVFRTAIGHQLAAPPDDGGRGTAGPAQSGLPGGPARRPAAFSRPSGPDGSGPEAVAPVGEPATARPGTGFPRSRRGRGRDIVLAAAVTALVTGGLTMALLDRGGHSPASAAPASPSVTTLSDSPRADSGLEPSTVSATPRASASRSAAVSATPAAPDSAAAGTHDPRTLDIRSAACRTALAPGAHGDCVAALQYLLGGYGYLVPVDGDFEARTLAALKVFQTSAGLSADGRVGSETKAMLYSRPRGAVRSGTLTVTETVNGVATARCLDADTGTATLKQQTVQIWECTGAPHQKWALYPLPGRDAQYVAVNRSTHRCLEADAAGVGQNGHGIHGTACDGLAAQRWSLGSSGVPGTQALVSVPDGFCLDAEAATSGQDGQRVQAWSCAGNGNQAWHWG